MIFVSVLFGELKGAYFKHKRWPIKYHFIAFYTNADRFHCHAIKKKIENHSVDKVKKL